MVLTGAGELLCRREFDGLIGVRYEDERFGGGHGE